MELQFEGVCIGFTNIDNTHVNADNQFSLSISRSVCSITSLCSGKCQGIRIPIGAQCYV